MRASRACVQRVYLEMLDFLGTAEKVEALAGNLAAMVPEEGQHQEFLALVERVRDFAHEERKH